MPRFGIDDLKKLGKIVENATDSDIIKVLTKEGKELSIPKNTLKDGYGKVIRRGIEEEAPLKNMAEAKVADEQDALKAQLEAFKNKNLPFPETKSVTGIRMPKEEVQLGSVIRPYEGERAAEALQRVKAAREAEALKGTKKDGMKYAAGMLAAPAYEPEGLTNPLEYLKEGFDKYTKAKETINEKLAEQLDLTKDKALKKDFTGILNTVNDPINFIPGSAGLATGALQAGLEALPNNKSKLEEYLSSRRGR